MKFLKIIFSPLKILWWIVIIPFKVFYWIVTPQFKHEKKERSRLRKNARARAKTLEKKGKYVSAQDEKRKFGIWK